LSLHGRHAAPFGLRTTGSEITQSNQIEVVSILAREVAPLLFFAFLVGATAAYLGLVEGAGVLFCRSVMAHRFGRV
jgi:hypothetical protein